jgi:hypothetical protein
VARGIDLSGQLIERKAGALLAQRAQDAEIAQQPRGLEQQRSEDDLLRFEACIDQRLGFDRLASNEKGRDGGL